MKFCARHLSNLFWLITKFHLDHGYRNLKQDRIGFFFFEKRLKLRLMFDQTELATHNTLRKAQFRRSPLWTGIFGKDLPWNPLCGRCWLSCSGPEARLAIYPQGTLRRTSSPRLMVRVWLGSGCVNVISHLPLSRATSKARSGGSFVRSGLRNAALKSCSPASFCQRIPVASGQDLSLSEVCDGAGTDLGFL